MWRFQSAWGMPASNASLSGSRRCPCGGACGGRCIPDLAAVLKGPARYRHQRHDRRGMLFLGCRAHGRVDRSSGVALLQRMTDCRGLLDPKLDHYRGSAPNRGRAASLAEKRPTGPGEGARRLREERLLCCFLPAWTRGPYVADRNSAGCRGSRKCRARRTAARGPLPASSAPEAPSGRGSPAAGPSSPPG
jgi:hypothetical protein